jgi:iron complex outermembrane receptor protein
MLRVTVLTVLAGLFMAWAPAVQAQEADTSEVAMTVQMADSLVVTASRIAEPSRETGRRVTVYTQQDIQALSVNTIDQLLTVVGGIDTQSRAGFGVQSDLTLRGSTFNGVLLLLDGARLNDPMTGHFLMDLPVPLSEIVRVEVLRGPAAALYGPDALGGVIQLFTRTGLRQGRMADTGAAGSVGGRIGDHALYDATGSARYITGRTAASAAATAQGSDGQPIRTADGKPVRDGDGRLRTDFERWAGTAAVARTLGDATLYARAGIDDRSFSAWHFYTPFPSDSAREETATLWAQMRLRSDRDQTTRWQFQVAGKQHDDTYRFNPQVPASVHTSRLLTTQAQASRTVGSATLTGGLSGRVRGIDSNGLGTHTDASGGAFVRMRWPVTDRLTLNPSLRADVAPTYGFEPTPQLYAAYALDAVTLRAGGGRAVRAPNYIERYVNAGGNRGTPGLDAESAWSAEVGLDVRPRALPGLSLHATGFGRRTTDLIDYAQETPSAQVFVARNLHEVSTLGLELEATWDRTVRGARVRLQSAYTFLDAEFDTDTDVAAFKYALTSARHLLQGSASVRLGAATLGVQGLWKDRMDGTGIATDRYGLVHLRAGYTVSVADTPATLTAEVRNLLDRSYTEVFDAPMPDRTLLVGARLAF